MTSLTQGCKEPISKPTVQIEQKPQQVKNSWSNFSYSLTFKVCSCAFGIIFNLASRSWTARQWWLSACPDMLKLLDFTPEQRNALVPIALQFLFLPTRILYEISSFLTIGFVNACSSIPNQDIAHRITHDLSTAFSEEVFFRYLLQNVVLSNVGSLAGRVSPKAGEVIKHPATRIALTSLFFAMGHDLFWICDSAKLAYFIAGCVFGIVYETTGLIGATAIHWHHDAIPLDYL